MVATLVALGEFAIGLGLLVGLLTGIAGFFAAFVNGNFVLAGALGSNPLLVIFGILLALAWRNAGWTGLDRWFIPVDAHDLLRVALGDSSARGITDREVVSAAVGQPIPREHAARYRPAPGRAPSHRSPGGVRARSIPPRFSHEVPGETLP